MWWFCLLMMLEYVSAQVNLSPNGTATQSSTYTDKDGTWSAHFAIDDGGPTHEWTSFSCTHTDDDGRTYAWWMVSFPEQLYISNVVIYYRKEYPGRLSGYYLFVSNKKISNDDIDFTTGHLCFQHTGNNVPSILQNVTCNKLASNVIIYIERLTGVTYPSTYIRPPILELCDVQVIGCKKGFSGEGCKFQCPDYCIDNQCNPSTRECFWGCTSSKCLDNVCVQDGKCIYGCPQGFAGLLCDKGNIAKSKADVRLVTDALNQSEYLVTDGDKRETSCVRLVGQTNWIQIDTEHQHAVTDVYITLKDISLTRRFNIYVMNSSGDLPKPMNTTVHDLHIITEPMLIYEYRLSPVKIGRYVIVSFVPVTVNSFVDICEVEVIGTIVADENTNQKTFDITQGDEEEKNNENKYLIPLVITSVTTVVLCIGFVVLLISRVRKKECSAKTDKNKDSQAYETTLKETPKDSSYHEVQNKYTTNISEYEEIS